MTWLMTKNKTKFILIIIFMIATTFTIKQLLNAEAELSSANSRLDIISSVKEHRPSHRSHPYGGTLVWGAKQNPSIINPILTTHTISINLICILFNRLMRINAAGEIEPDLAERWEISDDGLIYTFFLREGVKFHDGIEFTAEDVKFTFEQFLNPENNCPYRFYFDLVEKIEVLDQYTLRIVLSKPFPVFLSKLADREIVPKHLLEGKNLAEAEFNYHPVGTGPFKFKSWDKVTDQIELEYNPDYFEGRPYLDKIVVKVFANTAQLWSAIMREEIDLMLYVNSENFQILKDNPEYKTFMIRDSMYCAISYNLDDFILRDKEVRIAIAQAISRKQILEAISQEGIESTGPFYPDSPGFNPGVKALPFDPVEAKMRLLHRGWEDKNANGILEKDGKELTLKMLVDKRSPVYIEMAKIIRQQLSEIGIKIQVLYYQDEAELTDDFLREHQPNAWLRFFHGFGTDPYESVSSWQPFTSRFSKLWKYNSDEVNRLFDLGRTEKDKGYRNEIYRDIHEIIYSDQPACFLFYRVSYYAISKKFNDVEGFFNRRMPMYTINDWYVGENEY